MTSNRAFGEWTEMFGDPVVTTALHDRLLNHAIVIQIEGTSYQLRAHADLIDSDATRPTGRAVVKKRRGRPPKKSKEVVIYN